ncbi:MAG: signal peptide peptidase SppA [Spirochaetes bacterium]|nr:signal peptide peptidase SppA [Spirochaetota bacterium]
MARPLRMSYYIMICVIVSMTWTRLVAATNPFPSPARGSVSHTGGPFGAALNPVFADLPGTPMAAYQYRFFDGRKKGSHFVGANLYGFSFMYGWHRDVYLPAIDALGTAGAHHFRFTRGFFFRNIAGFGIGYSFSRSRNRIFRGYRGLSWGLLVRPIRFVSLGFVMEDAWGEINAGGIPWREVYSISIRPYTERITLSLDLARKKGGRARDLEYRVTADARLPYGINLFLTLDGGWNLLFGAAFPLMPAASRCPSAEPFYYRSLNRVRGPDHNSIGVALGMPGKRRGLLPWAGKQWLSIAIDGRLREIEKKSFWGREATVFYDIVAAIERASEDPSIRGIILRIDRADIGFAQVQELRREMKKARGLGKRVYAVMTGPGNREYYLASAAERIYYPPHSTFHFTGLVARVYFIRGLMEKIGVEFESFKRGAYKSFDETFTREGMSDAFRENVTSILSDMNEQYLSDILEARKISRERVEDLFRRGHLTPDEAVERGFVDVVGYPDEAVEEIGRAGIVELEAYRQSAAPWDSWGPVPRVALVVIEGSIVSGNSFNTGFFRTIGEGAYRRALERAFRDPLVRAVVVRVNSGGGSATASDIMLHDLARLKKKHDKPVVFSFGNIAASGGYYAACTGDTIFTGSGSITGSIGVVFGKLTLQDLYRKLGIRRESIAMSEFADIFSESRHLTEREKKIFQEGVDFSYRRFTGRVMKARGFGPDEIGKIAEGRVFTGGQAMKNRLADRGGGVVTAVAFARSLAGISGPFDIVKFPDERGPLLNLFNFPELHFVAERISGLFDSAALLSLREESALYLVPYRIEIR